VRASVCVGGGLFCVCVCVCLCVLCLCVCVPATCACARKYLNHSHLDYIYIGSKNHASHYRSPSVLANSIENHLKKDFSKMSDFARFCPVLRRK